jgi:Putative Flp pilus-assembly TadE/G-like
VMTAMMLVGLTAFTAFVVDYGILWVARRQIQNAADAAAMAAAMSLAFDIPGDLVRARSHARTAAAQNSVWGAPPTMTDGDITIGGCPAGAIGTGTCVRVEAFRNQARGSALPTVFGALVGVAEQGVRATATAQVLYGDATDCVKPLAIPDKWSELNPAAAPWDQLQTFDRYNLSVLKSPADYYEPPGGGLYGPNGTGYSRGPSSAGAGDWGGYVLLRPTAFPLAPGFKVGNERFFPVQTGTAGFLNDFATCSSTVVGPGALLQIEQLNLLAETRQAANTLVNQDPGAYWDATRNGGLGGVAGGCMAAGTCAVSPRVIALPAFSPDVWDQSPAFATVVTVTRIVGLFIEAVEAAAVVGRVMVYPVVPRSTMTADPASSFVVSVTLVR